MDLKQLKKTRTLVQWSALFLAVVFITLLYTLYTLEKRSDTDRFIKSHSNFTEQSASFLRSWLESEIRGIRSLANDSAIINICKNPRDPEQQLLAVNAMASRQKDNPRILQLSLITGTETDSQSITWPREETNHVDASWHHSMKHSGTKAVFKDAPYYVSRVFKNSESDLHFNLTVPVVHAGERIGALTITVPANYFTDAFLIPYADPNAGRYILIQHVPVAENDSTSLSLLEKINSANESILHASQEELTRLENNADFLCIAKRIPMRPTVSETDWYLIYIQHRSTMLLSTFRLLRAILLLGIIGTIAYAAIAMTMHRIITTRNRELANANIVLEQQVQDRQLAEKALKAKDSWLSSIQNNIQTGIIIIDKQTRRIVDANPAACSMSGCSLDELKGRICHNFICPNEEGHCPIIDHGKHVDNSEKILLSCDHKEVPILKTVVEIVIEGRTYLLESFADITALKKAENELRRNQALLNEVQDVAKIGGWEWDIQANSLLWTDEVFWLAEIPPNKQFTLHHATSLFLPEYRKVLRKTIFDSVRQNRPFDLELPVVTDKGSQKWVRVMGRPEYQNQKPWRLLGVFQDITVQKTTEDRLSMALTAANDGMWDLDCNTMETHYSPRWYTMLGYDAYEFPETYETWERLVHPDDRIETERLLTAYVTGESSSFNTEIRMKSKKGDWLWILARAKQFVTDGEGKTKRLIGTHMDITELKETQHKLEEARIVAEQANRAKSSFLAVMSHEIRTPMNAVIGMTSLLLNTILSDKQRDYVETVKISADALLNLINDILDFSKIEAGHMDLEQAPFTIRDVVEEALDLLINTALDKNLELAYIMENNVPNQVVGDRTRLRQILVNLINNAIKFTTNGEIVVRVDSTPLQDDLHKIVFSVRDTGIGISSERIGHLFDAFMQADASTTRRFGGTGLGLTISKRLSKLMGGDMWAESEPDQGSTFFFYITVKAQPSKVNVYLRERNPTLSGKKLLIVDDHATNREILHFQAETWGMVTSEAEDASQAMSLLNRQNDFDLAVLDYDMPDTDGAELATMIKNKMGNHSFPLIMLSSMNKTPAPNLFAAHLAKPVKPSQLYKAMVDVLGVQPLVQITPAKPHIIDHRTAERMPLNILLAEDNIINQKVALHILKNMGYAPTCVDNGEKAVQACKDQHFDMILMDVQMPVMDGLSATRKIRETDKSIYIVALTAGALAADQSDALEAGMNMYLSKPIRITKLVEALEQTHQHVIGT